MAPQEWWWLALGIGAVVVAVVAVLLGLIIAAARSIDEHARGIWIVGKQIAGNTVAFWMLKDLTNVTDRVRRAADNLDETGESMVRLISTSAPPARGG